MHVGIMATLPRTSRMGLIVASALINCTNGSFLSELTRLGVKVETEGLTAAQAKKLTKMLRTRRNGVKCHAGTRSTGPPTHHTAKGQ